jgi:branched-chain amino acid transport system substrate-binding protein
VAGFDPGNSSRAAGADENDAMDPQLADDPGMRKYLKFLTKGMGGADRSDGFLATGYTTAQAVELVLRRCGDDLTRENVMR